MGGGGSPKRANPNPLELLLGAIMSLRAHSAPSEKEGAGYALTSAGLGRRLLGLAEDVPDQLHLKPEAVALTIPCPNMGALSALSLQFIGVLFGK